MRARPEPTQLEHLSDASFLGKLLVLPLYVRLDWKVIVRYKHSSLFGLVVRERKKFYNIDTWFKCHKAFASSLNKLERLFPECLFRQVLRWADIKLFGGRYGATTFCIMTLRITTLSVLNLTVTFSIGCH